MTPATPNPLLPPVHLGSAAPIDPFDVQPGVILFNRFCVIGRVRHGQGTWRVTATDLERRMGVEPHHRVDLHSLVYEPAQEYAVHAALPAHQRGGHRIEGILSVEGGMVLLAAPTADTPIRLPLAPDEAAVFVRSMLAIAAGMRRARIVGIRFDLRDLRIGPLGDVQFHGWRHLSGLRFEAGPSDPAISEDARALVDVVASLGDTAIVKLLGSGTSIEALYDAVLADRAAAPLPGADALPSRPPFIGRESLVIALQEAAARARTGVSEICSLVGGHGVGRTRILDQLALELHRWNSVLVVTCGFKASAGTFGLEVLLDAVAGALEVLPLRERVDAVARVRRSLGPLAGLLRHPRIAAIIGLGGDVPPLPLEERFIRLSHVVVELLVTLGRPERPLALLLDDADQADASVRAVLRGLAKAGRPHHTLVVLAQWVDGRRIALDVPETLVEPMSVGDARNLIAATLTGPVDGLELASAALHAAGHGSPREMWHTLQQWVADGALRPSGDGRWRFDGDIDEATDNHPLVPFAPSLDDSSRFVALIVAVRTEPVTVPWLVEVAGLPPATTRSAAAALVDAKLLVPDSSGRLLLIDERERLQATADPADIARAHAAIAAWLRARVGTTAIAQEAWHAEHASPPGVNPHLAELHLDAGRHHLEQCDAARAHWHFSRVGERTEHPEARLAAMQGIADALLLLDDIPGAFQVYQLVLDRITDAKEALETVNRSAHALYLRGATSELIALAVRAFDRAGEPLPETRTQTVLHVVRSLVRAITRLGPRDPVVADGLVTLYTTLAAAVSTSHPQIGFVSLFGALAAAIRHHTPTSARGRALFSVLLGMGGLYGPMRRLVAVAEVDAEKDPLQLGSVLHFRAQNEWGAGRYAEAQAAAAAAVAAFREAGDMSVGVITQAMSVFYALDRDPLPELLHRIAETRAITWRQRNTALQPAVDGMEMLVEARMGALRAEQLLERSALRINVGDLFGAVVSDALVGLALVHLGRGADALSFATRARERVETSVAPPFLAIAYLAEAEALVAAGHLERAAAAIRVAERRARSAPNLKVACRMLAARFAVRQDRTEDAILLLREVIEQSPQHRELWHTLTAHRLLSELVAGRDIVAATGHASMAEGLAAKLGLPLRPTQATPPPRPEAVRTLVPPPNAETRLWEVVDRLSPTLRGALPGGMTLSLFPTAGIRAEADPAAIELLVVNLFLLARDASRAGAPQIAIRLDEVELGAESASAIAGARPGRWARLAIATTGQIAKGSRAALLECRALAAQCNGSVHVDAGENQLTFTAYLPAPSGPPPAAIGTAVVAHRDPRIGRMLIEGVQRAGWGAIELSVGARCPPDATVALVDATLDPALFALPSKLPVIQVGRRGVETRHDPAVFTIRVPFLVGELEQALREASAAAAKPTETGWPPG